MKRNLLKTTKIGLALLTATMSCSLASGTAFVALATGNWSSPATWTGGTVPHFKLGSTDQVTIGTGLIITMDSTIVMNGAAGTLALTGELTSTTNSIIVNAGTFSGSGTINADSVVMATGAIFSFSGSLTANVVSNSIAILSTPAVMIVNSAFTNSGAFTVMTSGSLIMGAGSIINVKGGSIAVTGGTLTLTSAYSVNYISPSITSGLELGGVGLKNITVNVSTGNIVTMASSIILADSLKMISGSLALSGHKLTVNGVVSGAGTFIGDAKADLVITTTSALTSTIAFIKGSQLLNGLTLNVGSGKAVALISNLTVDSTLTLSGGSNLTMNGDKLTLNGGFAGTGSFMVNAQSALIINNTTSIVPPISLSGTTIGNFVLNVGAINTVTLNTDLNVDTLNLETGTLVLNGHNLSIDGNITALGAGMVFASATSNVSVTASSSTGDSLTFTYPGNTVNNFTVNIGAAGSVMLGSDLIVNGKLKLMNGHINTGANNLQIATGGTVSGANSNSYVITNEGGYLTMNALVSAIDTFPVGTITSYSPASIMLNPGSTTGTVSVNVSKGVYAAGTTGTLLSATQPMVNSTWLFETSITSGLNANMQLTWAPATEVNGFIHTGDYISHYTSGAWDKVSDSLNASVVAGGMFSIERKAITSMSPFAVFNRNAVTGISEVVANESFEVYPNPVSQNLYIKNNDNTTGLLYVNIYNVLGQVVSTSTITSSNSAISVNGLAPGNYFVKVSNDKMTVVKKFIKI